MAFCSKCGEQLSEGSSFCSKCGEQPTTTKEGKSTPFWFILLIFFVLVGMGGGIYALFTSADKMTVVVDEQLEALGENKITKAYSLYTSKEFQNATSLKEYRNFVKTYPILSENASHSFHTKSIDNNIGVLIGSFTAADGTIIPVKYQLTKEDSEWKILSIELGKKMAESQTIDSQEQLHDIESPIQAQLLALRNANLKTAYDETAKDFREATTWEKFQLFVKAYPIFSEYQDIEFKDHERQGDKAIVTALLTNRDGAVPVEYKLTKEGGKWKIWSLHLMMPLIADEKINNSNPQQLKQPVEDQLKALRDGDIQKAYSYVSQAFKAATNFEEFQNFVVAFPVFTSHEAKIEKPYFDQGAGKIKVFLTDSSGTTELEYTLALEDDQWKIWGMQIVSLPEQAATTESDTADFNMQDLVTVIEAQLNEIKKGDIKKAYDTYTSQDFKEATNFQIFKQFLTLYPIFSSFTKANFSKLMFNNNIASIKGTLTAPNGNTQLVEFDLTKENDIWKVLTIKILSSEEQAVSNEPSDSNLEISKVNLGTQVNLNGMILEPSTTLPKATEEIYANVFIENGTSGTDVTVIFYHIDSGASIPPVSTSLQQNGSSMLSFVFTPPVSGWPKGNYSLKIRTSTGKSRNFPFKIIE